MCGIVGYVGPKKVVPSFLTASGGSNIADTIPQASPLSAMTARSQIRRAAGKAAQPRRSDPTERRSMAPTASATRAGPHTAAPPKKTPIRTATAPARSWSSTTASSKITSTSRSNSSKRATSSSLKPTPKSSPTWSKNTMKRTAAPLEEARFARRSAAHRRLFALAVISADEPNKIVAARNGPAGRHRPGRGRIFRRLRRSRHSLPHPRLFFLADGDIAVLTPQGVRLTDFEGQPIERHVAAHHLGPDHGGKGRLQAFHAQGDFRAAARRARYHCSAAFRRTPATSSSMRWTSPRQEFQTASRTSKSSPAAPVGTPAWPASS